MNDPIDIPLVNQQVQLKQRISNILFSSSFLCQDRGMALKSIQTKTFLLLLGMTVSMAIILVLLISLRFDRGFNRYKKNIYDEVNRHVVEQLVKLHQQDGHWHRLKNDRGLWQHLLINSLIENEAEDNLARRPVNRQFFKYHTLLSANKEHIMGHALHRHPQMSDLPIKLENQVIGYLRVPERSMLINKIDRSFNHTMQQWLYVLLLAAFIFALLLSWPISRYFTRPIRRLNNHVKKMSEGHYGSLIHIHRKDELGRLGQNINQLSETLKANSDNHDQLFTDISHELRTPVAVLRAHIEAMQDGIKECDSKQLDQLHHQTMALSLLINDIQDLAGTEMGSLQYKKESVDISHVFNNVIKSFSTAIDEKKLTLFKHIQPAIYINGDALRLRQLFNNLINNAIEYTERGGQIHMKLEADEQQVLIVIEDSEPGVDAQWHEKIFEHLFRPDSGRSKQQGGFGVGLAIAKNIVTAHQGTIWAADSNFGGLAVTVQIPMESHNHE